MANVMVDRGGVGPICFHRDNRKALLFDQVPRDRGAGLVELRRAVARFAQQDDAGLREAIEQGTEVGTAEGRQRFDGGTDHLGQRTEMRVPRDVVAGGTRAVLGPSVLPDQGHEADGPEGFFIVLDIALARDPQKRLFVFGITNRNDEAPADGQLPLECIRRDGTAGGDQDRVEWRRFGQAAGTIAGMDDAICRTRAPQAA